MSAKLQKGSILQFEATIDGWWCQKGMQILFQQCKKCGIFHSHARQHFEHWPWGGKKYKWGDLAKGFKNDKCQFATLLLKVRFQNT